VVIEEWYEQYAPELTRFIRSRGFTTEDAEDLTAQVFLEAVQRQPEDIAPRAWLYRVANSRIIDRWRADGRRTTQALHDYEGVASSCELSVEQVDSVRSQLDRLPPLQRRVLELRFVQGLTLSETADALKRSIAAVKALQWRAQATIRKSPRSRPVSLKAVRCVWWAVTATPCASIRRLSAQIGLSPTTVKNALDVLRDAGYIEFEQNAVHARTIVMPFGPCTLN
jgi:RNA polymerase sigma factor (sigma-70 family)